MSSTRLANSAVLRCALLAPVYSRVQGARYIYKPCNAGRVRQPTVKMGRSKSSGDLPIRADAQPAPGAHQDLSHLHPNKDSGPKFSFGCRDGISPETFAKSRLGVVAHRKAETKRCARGSGSRLTSFLSLAERLPCRG